MGAHQKIDRVARRQLAYLIPRQRFFPDTASILQFEGKNGPDGIKAKSPSRDEPWHYVDPSNHADTGIYDIVNDHFENLVVALTDGNKVRAGFEAAWLAHALTDGLTPAHHYPLSDKIEELWGHPKEERTSIRSKNIIPGDTKREKLSKNWQYWGAKGIFTTHVMFEFGVSSTITPMRFNDQLPNANLLVRVKREGIEPIFREAVATVYGLGMYDEFHRKGWTRHLARQTRQVLAPLIVNTVLLAWYLASERAAVRRANRT